jgi:anti-anti-sigma regulatory factor
VDAGKPAAMFSLRRQLLAFSCGGWDNRSWQIVAGLSGSVVALTVRGLIMSTPQGIVHFLRHGQTLDVQVEGWGTIPQSLPIRRLAEHSFADGVAVLRMDLRRCTYMDSTFLGTLLYLKRVIDRRGQGQLALISPSCQCRQLLQQMGLENVYLVIEEEPPDGPWTVLPTDTVDANGLRHNVVEAHQELATLHGQVGATFREVARGMTQAMKQAKKDC